MAKEIKVPVPDQTTEEVRIVKWVKNEGETVAKGEVILEVETDKSVMEVESIEDGVLLKQLAQVDDMVPVSAVVAYVGKNGEVVEEEKSSQGEKRSQGEKEESGQGSVVRGQKSEGHVPSGVKELKIPVPDQTTEEVRIVQWKKEQGQTVSKGEVVLEVETDKSVMEVESIEDGVLLKQLVQVDDMVAVGAVVAYVGPAGVKIEEKESGQGSGVSGQEEKRESSQEEGKRVKASPMAKKLAGKLGVDLAGIVGSGPQGRIVREDVEKQGKRQKVKGKSEEIRGGMAGGRIIASPNAKRLAAELGVDLSRVTGSGSSGRIVGADIERFAKTDMPKRAMPVMVSVGMPSSGKAAEGQPEPGTSGAITKMRRAIGKNLQMSFRDTPHFFVTMSADMSRAMALRSELNAGRPKEKRVSVNDLVVRAAALALKQYPAVNSRMDENEIHYLKDINVGVAIAIEAGLVVPVLTNADQKDWYDLAQETRRLAQEARAGKIRNAGKGTFTVSNLGMFGVEEFTAIINPPESAILAVGAVQNQVVDIGGGIGVRPMMKMTLCSDHRVIDGALAAQFLRAIKLYLEEEMGC